MTDRRPEPLQCTEEHPLTSREDLLLHQIDMSRKRGSYDSYKDKDRLHRRMEREAQVCESKKRAFVDGLSSSSLPEESDETAVVAEDVEQTEMRKPQARKRGKNSRNRESYVKDMRGPFPAPFSDATITMFKYFRFRHRTSDSVELANYEDVEMDEDVVRLMVGDRLLEVCPMQRKRTQHTIFDFQRDRVIVGWKRGSTTNVTTADLNSGTYHRLRVGKDGRDIVTKIKAARFVWVRRDPSRSRAFLGESNDSEAFEVLGEGTKVDYPWSRLSEIPTKDWAEAATDSEASVSIQAMVDGVPCMFCNESVKFSDTLTSWEQVTPDAESRRRYAKFRQHCKERHPSQVHWALAYHENTFQEGETFGIRDRLQWALQQAMLAHPLPLEYVVQLFRNGDGIQFRCHLSLLLGFARGQNLATDTMRKLRCFKNHEHKNLLDFGKFKAMVDEWLHRITIALMRFDFRTLGASMAGSTNRAPLLLWNALLLFFCRGAYMEPPFIPLIHLGVIPNTSVPMKELVL